MAVASPQPDIRAAPRSLPRSVTILGSTGSVGCNTLDLIEREPDYAALPLEKARAFTRMLDLPEAASPIVPIVLGGAERTLQASRLLEDEGFLVIAIRPPTVADGTARLRVTFSAAHEDEDIERLAAIIGTRILDEGG